MEKFDNHRYVETVHKWKQKEIKDVSALEAVLSNFSILFD